GIALDSHLIIAKIEDEIVDGEIVTNEKVPILNIPPGFFGFNFESEIPSETEEELLAEIDDLEILTDTKLRDEPRILGTELATVNKGSKVKPINLSMDENWVFVQFGDKQGWLPATQIIVDPEVSPTPLKVNASTVVIKDPLASPIEIETTLTKESIALILSKNESMIQIQSDLTTGWVLKTTEFIETVYNTNSAIDTAHATRELRNLYQLLGFDIKGKTNNKLPIGPTIENDDSIIWQYERLVPAYTHFSSEAVTSPSDDLVIPDPEKNPYKGIKTDTNAKLDIQFWWQDVYGNKLTTADPVEKSFEVKYTDPIIGINQWPSITESFQFVRDDDDNVNLEIELSFSTKGYQNLKPGGATARRLKADLESFTKVYYQINQSDIDLLIHSSLNETWEASFKPDEVSNKDNLLTFVVKIYNYLFELYEYLLLVEELKGINEAAINLEIDNEIALMEPELIIAIESKIADLLEAELEAEVIPVIIKNIEDATEAEPVESYEDQFKLHITDELPAKITSESPARVEAELKIQKDQIRKILFDEKLAVIVENDGSITPQANINYHEENNSFTKILNINVSPEGDFPLETKNDFIQGLDVSISITREASNIHRNLHVDLNPDLGIDTKYESVEKSKAILSPKHESSNYTILSNQSLQEILQGIKDELSTFPQQSISIENMVQWNQDEVGIINEGASFPLLLGGILSEDGDTFKSLSTQLDNEININIGRSNLEEDPILKDLRLKEDFAVNFKLKSDVFNLEVQLTIDDDSEEQKQLMLFSQNLSLQEMFNLLPAELSTSDSVEKLVEWNQDELDIIKVGLSFSLESLIDLDGEELTIIQGVPPIESTVHDTFSTIFTKVKNALNGAILEEDKSDAVLNYSLDDFAEKIKGLPNIFNDYSKLTIKISDTQKHFILLSEEPSLQGIIETLKYDLQETFTIDSLVDQLWELDGIIQKDVDYKVALIELDDSQFSLIENISVSSLESDTLNILAARVKKELINKLSEDADLPKPVVNLSLNDFVKIFKDKTGIFKTDAKLNIESLNLRNFATNFSEAFPQFHLAVSEERNSTQNSGAENDRSQPGPGKFLFAVHLGNTGISYDIEEQDPNFYAIPPLATSLFTGKVLIQNYPFDPDASPFEKEVNAVDMNVLARDFLVAFEDFLKPETLIPAFKLAENQVIEIIETKYRLAERISDTVLPVLVKDNGSSATADNRLLEAQKAIRHKLRLNLIEGYDIEAIVQFQSNVTDNIGLTGTELLPRFTGRAKVLGASFGEDPNHLEPAKLKSLDYLITPGYFELSSAGESSSLTYLFDTKSPEKFGNIHLELEFEPLEIEYNLNKIQSEFLASDKLRFVLPEKLNVYQFTDAMVLKLKILEPVTTEDEANFNQLLTQLSGIASDTTTYSSLQKIETALKKVDGINLDHYEQFRHKILTFSNPNYMGKSAVPIPLRNYPQPPSLIFQRAESDDSSLENINDLREWEYKIVYEHQDIAQDSIDCIVKLNILEKTLGAGVAINYDSAADAAAAAETAAIKAEEERTKSEEAFNAVIILKQEEAEKRQEAESLTDATEKINKLKEAREKATAASTKALEAKEAAENALIAFDEATFAAKATDKLAEVDSTEANLAIDSKAAAETSAEDAQTWATQAAEAVDNLFDALINFAEILPDLRSHFALLSKDPLDETDETENGPNATKAINAIYALNQLSSLIAANWDNVEIYNNASFYEAEDKDLHFEISEEPLPDNIEGEEPIKERQATIEWINPTTPRDGIKPLNTLLDLPSFSRHLSSGDDIEEGDNIKTFKYTEGNSNEYATLKDFETAIKEIEGIDLDDYEKFKDIILDLAESNELPTVYQITDDIIKKLRKPGTVEEEDEKDFKVLITKLEVLEKAYAFDPHDYGDSSIPDRVFRIENLDVLQYQNAAASIWLSRNKTLVFDEDTNPAFVFQTPAVSFANSAIPFITNDEPFDIAALGSADGVTPQDHDFQVHMENLLKLIEPNATTLEANDYRYEARLSCRFAFSLAKGKGLNDDLVSTLPLLIGLRLSPGDSLDDKNRSEILKAYPGKLKTEISKWFEQNRPIEESAYLLFSLDIFSKLDPNENSSLPMLRVKRLELKLKNIEDMDQIRTGNI
ncbi:MAG: hypothetical protein AB8F94_10230, partial [Saprospiraceae bacterium]